MRKFLAEAVFGLHAALDIFWYSLFFVPLSWWPERISFHFYFTLVIISHQFIWGGILIPKMRYYRLVCVLTTIMQSLRGRAITDSENHRHSFFEEAFARIGIKIPPWMVFFVTSAVAAAVAVQYFFAR